MNEHLKQGWIDIPMLTKLNVGGGKTRLFHFILYR